MAAVSIFMQKFRAPLVICNGKTVNPLATVVTILCAHTTPTKSRKYTFGLRTSANGDDLIEILKVNKESSGQAERCKPPGGAL